MLIRIDKTEHLFHREGKITTHALYLANTYLIITTSVGDKGEEIEEILKTDIAPPVHKDQLLALCASKPNRYTINTNEKEAYLAFLDIRHKDSIEFTGPPMPTESFELMKEWYREHIRQLQKLEDPLFSPSPEVLEAITREKLIKQLKPLIGQVPEEFSYDDFHTRKVRTYKTIRSFVEWLGQEEKNTETDQKVLKRPPAKYYALYHWICIEMGMERAFELNDDDKYSRKVIEDFVSNRYPEVSPQGFYRTFVDIDITDKNMISKVFGKGYKEIITRISDNNPKIISHLKKYPG